MLSLKLFTFCSNINLSEFVGTGKDRENYNTVEKKIPAPSLEIFTVTD
jgi:hypothetical protein